MFYPKFYRRITGADSEDGTQIPSHMMIVTCWKEALATHEDMPQRSDFFPPCQLSLHSSLVDLVESPQLPAPSWLSIAFRPWETRAHCPEASCVGIPHRKGPGIRSSKPCGFPGVAWGCVGWPREVAAVADGIRWNALKSWTPSMIFSVFVDPMPLSYYTSQEIYRNIHIRHHDQCRGWNHIVLDRMFIDIGGM